MATINGTTRGEFLYGGRANDVIHGWGGADQLFGRAGHDTLYGEKGNDVLYGEDGNDRLYGGPGADVVVGGAGNDRLQGGPGDDSYWGGPGADRFVLTDVTDNGATGEFIHDYAFNDTVDLSAIDANWNQAGNQAFRYLGEGDFTGRAGEVVVRFLGEGMDQHTRYYLDVDGNGLADMTVTLDGGWFRLRTGDELIL